MRQFWRSRIHYHWSGQSNRRYQREIFRNLLKGPELKIVDVKILFWGQTGTLESLNRLRAAVEKLFVYPQTKTIVIFETKRSVHASRLVTRSQHTWPDGETVEVAPEDEVVVPPPVVNLQDSGGAGEQPRLARAVESLAYSRRVWQKRPEYFLKSWSSLNWCVIWIKFALTWCFDWMTRSEGPSWCWQFL